MPKMNDAKTMASYISCLSMLENNTSLLYRSLSEKTGNTLAKSLLLSIAKDSSKHSELLKGLSESIVSSEVKTKDCAKNLGQIWLNVDSYFNEVTSKKVGELSFADLDEKLISLESSLGEEYYIFVQMQTLQHLTSLINRSYNIDLDSVKSIFENIIRDENRHIEVIGTLKKLVEPQQKEYDYTPIVKYQSPDRWLNFTPDSP